MSALTDGGTRILKIIVLDSGYVTQVVRERGQGEPIDCITRAHTEPAAVVREVTAFLTAVERIREGEVFDTIPFPATTTDDIIKN